MVLKKVMKQLFSPSVRPDRNTVKKKTKKTPALEKEVSWRDEATGEAERQRS